MCSSVIIHIKLLFNDMQITAIDSTTQNFSENNQNALEHIASSSTAAARQGQ